MPADFLWWLLPGLPVGFGLLLWVYFPTRPSLRVLLYHKIRPVVTDGLTVSTAQFEQQLSHLRTAGYAPISLPHLLRAHRYQTRLPRRAVLLTVDDAYADFAQHALPILLRHAVPAALFVPMAHIGGHNDWDGGQEPILTADELRSAADAGISLGYHSCRHENYKQLSINGVSTDLANCRNTAQSLDLAMEPAFAYPYGGRPTNAVTRRAMEQLLGESGIELAFRIGNRVNRWPARNAFALNRIDVRGRDSLVTFRRRLWFGRWL